MQSQVAEKTERKRRLAKLRLEQLRELRQELDQQDEVKDPEYMPEPREKEETVSTQEP